MARLVLSDASHLIALARVDGLDWMRRLFGEVWITPEVMAEVLPGKGLRDEHLIAEALNQGWLRLLGPTPSGRAYTHLGIGESSCLRVAAMHPDSCLLLVDDRLARREAHRIGISVVGTAGLIGLCHKRGLIPSARDVLERLLRSDFRIAHEVIASILKEIDPSG